MAKSRTKQTTTDNTGSVKPSGTTVGNADRADPRPTMAERAYSSQTDTARQAAINKVAELLDRRDAAIASEEKWRRADARGVPSELKIIEKDLPATQEERRVAESAVSVARGDFHGDFQQSPSSKRTVPEPVQRSQAAQEEILAEIRQQGHNPLALPKARGVRGVKAAIKAALGRRGTWARPTVFDHAWDALRKSGEIADAASERQRPVR